MKEDKRPAPKPRKHAALWQMYLLWDESMKIRQRHTLRIDGAEKGKNNFDAIVEQTYMDDMAIERNLNNMRKLMIAEGKRVPVWGWVTSIKGLGAGGEAAKLLAQIDDIKKFETVSKLWRFAGYAVFDGKAEKAKAGEGMHYNRNLKAICYVIAVQFIKQQTPHYTDIYYAEKKRQRELHPEPVNGKYTDGHIHYMAIRKMIKQFLCELWEQWNEVATVG